MRTREEVLSREQEAEATYGQKSIGRIKVPRAFELDVLELLCDIRDLLQDQANANRL